VLLTLAVVFAVATEAAETKDDPEKAAAVKEAAEKLVEEAHAARVAAAQDEVFKKEAEYQKAKRQMFYKWDVHPSRTKEVFFKRAKVLEKTIKEAEKAEEALKQAKEEAHAARVAAAQDEVFKKEEEYQKAKWQMFNKWDEVHPSRAKEVFAKRAEVLDKKTKEVAKAEEALKKAKEEETVDPEQEAQPAAVSTLTSITDAGDDVPAKGASTTANPMHLVALLLAALAVVAALAALASRVRASKAREWQAQTAQTELSLRSSVTLP